MLFYFPKAPRVPGVYKGYHNNLFKQASSTAEFEYTLPYKPYISSRLTTTQSPINCISPDFARALQVAQLPASLIGLVRFYPTR